MQTHPIAVKKICDRFIQFWVDESSSLKIGRRFVGANTFIFTYTSLPGLFKRKALKLKMIFMCKIFKSYAVEIDRKVLNI